MMRSFLWCCFAVAWGCVTSVMPIHAQGMIARLSFDPYRDIPNFSDPEMWELGMRKTERYELPFTFEDRSVIDLTVGYQREYMCRHCNVYGAAQHIFFSEEPAILVWWVMGSKKEDAWYALKGEDGVLHRASIGERPQMVGFFEDNTTKFIRFELTLTDAQGNIITRTIKRQ